MGFLSFLALLPWAILSGRAAKKKQASPPSAKPTYRRGGCDLGANLSSSRESSR